MTPRAHPLVQAAVAANRALGRDAELASASTDANVPIALGIPAIALGAGGKAGDAHLPTEWFENVEGALGIILPLLVTAVLGEEGQAAEPLNHPEKLVQRQRKHPPCSPPPPH